MKLVPVEDASPKGFRLVPVDESTIEIRGGGGETLVPKTRLVPEPEPVEAVPPPGAGYAFGRAALESFLDNVLGIPDLMVKLSTPVATGMEVGARMADEGLGAGLAALGERRLPLPSGEQATAAIDVLNQTLHGDLDPNVVARYRRSLQMGEAAREAHPAASAFGEIAGDAATLFTGRVPARGATRLLSRSVPPPQPQKGDVVSRLMQEAIEAAAKPRKPSSLMERLAQLERGGGDVLVAERLVAPAVKAAPAKAKTAPKRVTLEPGLRRAVDRWSKSPKANAFARGANKSLEAGIEGATLAILDEGDPLQTAALAAGGQALGSMALTVGATKSGLLGLAATAAGTAALLQMLKTAAPGGRDRILESIEAAFKKVTFAVGMGGLAGLLGAGRIRGEFAKDFPKIADAITALPRGGAISVLKDWAKADRVRQDRIERTLELLSADPGRFTPSERSALGKAIRDGSLNEAMDRLWDRREFREKVEP